MFLDTFLSFFFGFSQSTSRLLMGIFYSKLSVFIFNECLEFTFLIHLFHFISLVEIDIIPSASSDTETREFLLKVIDILLDYVKTQNDRNERILEFHHPEDMLKLLDLNLPESAVPLQQLIEDCAKTMKYQVRTGEYKSNITIFYENKYKNNYIADNVTR